VQGGPSVILLAVESEADREALRLALAPLTKRCSLILTGSLREARESLREGLPDLVMADLILPDGRGTDLIAPQDPKHVFPVVILGGLDSIAGAIVGGLIIGILENLAGGYLDPLIGGGAKELFPFIIMVLVLMIKPYGLFGTVKVEKV